MLFLKKELFLCTKPFQADCESKILFIRSNNYGKKLLCA